MKIPSQVELSDFIFMPPWMLITIMIINLINYLN